MIRLAYFSPLPPSKSGIADYNAEILPFLARGADLTVFVQPADEVRANPGSADYAVADAASYEDLARAHPFDLCVYHQGNNPYHEYIYERALQTPGLLVLHEHCLHHLIAWKTLGREDEESYRDEMFYAYGRRGLQIAEMRGRDVGSEYQQFLLPLNRRLVRRSRGVIVHNEYAASQLEFDGQSSDTPVAIIPHHLSPKVYQLDHWDQSACRRALGLPEQAWIVASFGFVTQSKRIPNLLSAFKRLLQIVPHAVCLIVGEDHWKWSVAPLIREMGLGERVRLTGYTEEDEFFRYLKAVDAVVNLRYPTAGETSGTLIRALGAGQAVIVSDYGQFGELPPEICLRVSPGPEEERQLYARLRALAYRPGLGRELGARASAWARRECEISRNAARYLEFAEQIIRRHAPVTRRTRSAAPDHALSFAPEPEIKLDPKEAMSYLAGFFRHDSEATGYLRVHGERILKTVELVPLGGPEERLLELSSYLQMTPLIRRDGRYGEISITNWWEGDPREKVQIIRNRETGEELRFNMLNLDVERDRFPFPDEHFSVALCCELIEHLTEDPMHMLVELHRVLQWGGKLILTTPNIASAFSVEEVLAGSSPYIYGSYNRRSRADRHSREYTPKDVRLALEAGGFKVERLFTENLWHKTDEEFLRWLDRTGVPRELRGDNIFAVARKASLQIERFPDRLYD